jgi:cytochrome c biogenesis protein CcdA
MTEFSAALFSALWLGILTSISPCPLATNIAAISFVGRRISKTPAVLTAGFLYTIGRSIAYILVGSLIVTGLTANHEISQWLQSHMNRLMGPFLIIIGMILIEWLKFNLSFGSSGTEALQKRVETMGLLGALLLGFVFAMSFCPVSAALFFGSLLPLAVSNSSTIIFPTVYGIGTALPVFIFALLLAFGANSIGKVYNRITAFETKARKFTGWLFIGIGLYFCLKYIFRCI